MSNELKNKADELRVIPRQDTLEEILTPIARRERGDAQVAPLWAAKLHHSYSRTMETVYLEYAAANGDVAPIDSSVSPAADVWEYYLVDQAGFADFIDDDGKVMPSSSMTASRHTGKMAEMGHSYDVTIFDLERAAAAGVPLNTLKQKHAKKSHDALTNWTWLFGDNAQGIVGLCTHPNISVAFAPLNAGSTSRLWANKTAAEIATDVSAMINAVAENTLEAYHAATVFLPFSLIRRLRDLTVDTGSGPGPAYSVLDWMQSRFSGDPETGQGKVAFRGLNECEASRRFDPRTRTDTTGLSGDFCLVLPQASSDELAFIRARPFTQRPPQDRDLVLHHITHSKIGGCKLQIPLAVHRFDFGTT